MTDETALASDWLVFFSSMARTKNMTRMEEGRSVLQVRTRVEVHSEQDPQHWQTAPVPEVVTPPTQSELDKRIEEVERLGEVGRLPESSPT